MAGTRKPRAGADQGGTTWIEVWEATRRGAAAERAGRNAGDARVKASAVAVNEAENEGEAAETAAVEAANSGIAFWNVWTA
jgi:hypothetical protein